MLIDHTNADLETRFDTASQIITHLYGLSLVRLDSRQAISEVCKKYRHHSIQQCFSVDSLCALRDQVTESSIFNISDAFLIHFMLFSVGGIPFFLGPYCSIPMMESDVISLVRKCDIHDLDITRFLLYRWTFPVLQDRVVQRIATAFIHAVDPNEPEKSIQRMDYTVKGETLENSIEEQQEHHSQLIEQRYLSEKQFINSLTNGNARAAIQNLRKIQQDISYLRSSDPTMEGERIGAAIVRTEARIAAILAGLPAPIIDRLSAVNTRETRRATAAEAVLASQENMIREFCKAIRNARTSRYSAMVQSVLYCLEHDYERKISFSSLAEDLEISETYMMTVFKKEVGMTPNTYLTQVRMRHAALLLSHGGMSIADISSAVGIPDANYFVKLFKREYGETPTHYRKRFAF